MLPGLRFERMAGGLTQKELAEKSGVGRDTIQKLETGQRPARPATIKKLADALGVEAEELMEEETVEQAKAAEKRVEVPVLWEDRDGRTRGETLRFRGRETDSYEERGVMFTLYECPGGFRVHVDYMDGEKAYLNPSEVNSFTGEVVYPTYVTAEELVEEFPAFSETIGVRRVRDID